VSGVDTLTAGLFYVGLGGAAWLLLHGHPRVELPRPLRLSLTLQASFVLALLAAVVWGDLAASDSKLRVTFLDVGQGDAILIETPDGRCILVDGGPSGPALAQALGAALPPDVRRLDLVVLTHAQDDHVTGLVEVLQRFEVGMALAGPLPGTTATYEAWQQQLERRSIPVHVAVAGEQAILGDDLRLEVLGPPATGSLDSDDPLNDNSVVLRLVYGKVSFLLTGDIAVAGEQALLASGADLGATVLKLAHHGSDGSSTPAFLAAVQPQVAVISSGAGNNFGHPSPTTLLRLAGIPHLRTDLNGSVRFATDGRRLSVDFPRGDHRVVSLGQAQR
jgi:competence protein ComEC